MKFIITICLAFAMTAIASGFVVSSNDDKWKNRFDELLMKEFEEKFDEIERNLLHLNEQYKEFMNKKTRELKEHILKELAIAENFMKGAQRFFEHESKRDDLNLFEKYNYETALETVKLLTKEIDALAKKVNDVEPNN